MMQNPLKNLLSHCVPSFNRFNQVLVTTLVAGVALASAMPTVAMAGEALNRVQAQTTSSISAALPDGVYLYGQSAQPDQVGQGYFVFEVKQGNVVGALYMPRSSFDCASGRFKQDQLALTVVNSYDRTTNPFEIAVERSSTVAASGNPAINAIGLEGFHRISSISANDQRILNVCKSDLAKRNQ